MSLTSYGHDVHLFTAHHDKNRCFEETVTGLFPVTVYGGFIPRHILHHFHAVCAYLRCLFVAVCTLLLWPAFDVVLIDQVSVTIPILKLKKTKVLFYCHFPDLLLAPHTGRIRKLYRVPIDMIEEATTGMADMILVNSKFTAMTFANTFKHLNAQGIQPSILYPAVNMQQFHQPCAYKLYFLSINRFERKKNIGLAISAFSMLVALNNDGKLGRIIENIQLILIGGFDKRIKENVNYLNELKDLAEMEGVADIVTFIPSCSTDEKNRLLSECLCVIYTPKDEHFGIVPLEAMAAGKPVIACNSGGPTETIEHGITGFLCDPTPQQFLQAMLKLVQEPDLPERMGREAEKHVSQFFSTKIFGQRLHSTILNISRRGQE